MRTIVVIPTYNERNNLVSLVAGVRQYAPDIDLLFVDDNSPDGTGELADELSQSSGANISVLHRRAKQGLGTAYVDGFRYALEKGYEIVLQMDADLSHDPSYLPALLARIADMDLVLGSRYLTGVNVVNWDFKRLLLSKLASVYARWITGMPVSDPTGGFKCWRSQSLAGVGLESVSSIGYLFQIEMTYKAFRHGLRIAEVPIIFYERRLGQSKMNWRVIWEAFWGVLKLRLQRPTSHL